MKYTEIIEAKNNSKIPLVEKIALHSKYNPEREAEAFANQFDDESLRFFIVLGLAGGYHISALLKKIPNAKIIVYEESEEDISFLHSIPEVTKIRCDKRVIISNSENLKKDILTFYKPALYGNLTITTLRAWENVFIDEKKAAIENIQNTIKMISADYSVQSHFGKIWQKNIFENLKIASKLDLSFEEINRNIQNKKIAAIIAAGPTLNETINLIEKNREDYFIIATDTAFSILNQKNIKTDVVVSIDGQMISHTHYMNKIDEETIFLFDLCANSSAVRHVLKASKKIIFAETGHPLSKYASTYTQRPSFIKMEAGSGTVTIAAVNFATLLGFSKIEIFGADFSYINGLSYAKGTYLDKIYKLNESKLDNLETRFDRLMYRTELKKIGEKQFTTDVLESYSTSLISFMETNGFSKKDKNTNTQYFENKNNKKFDIELNKFNYKNFIQYYEKNLSKSFEELNEESAEFLTILPLSANLNSSILAYSKTLEYTKKL